MLFPARRLDEPRDLRVVAALQAVGAGRSTVQLPTMSASFRDELRTQLVAVAPRLVSEGVRPGTESAARPAAGTRRASAAAKPAARPARARTRPMTVLVAGAAVVVLGLGGATWLARNSLPGDALYGLKRTAEGVDVSFAGNENDKGKTLLLGAQKRVEEVAELVKRPQSMALGTGTSAAGGLSDSTVKLVVSTLATADTGTQKGVTTIGDHAVATGDLAGLTLVVGWAGGDDGKGGQIGRIQSLVDRIPSTAAHTAAQTSLDNIDAAYQRATALKLEVAKKITCARGRDQFGPKPCGVTATTPSTPSQPTTTTTSGATTSNPGGGTSTAPTSSAPSAPAPTSGAATPSSTPTSAKTSRATSSTAPAVSVGTCGVQVGLPVATVSLGTCTPTP